MTDDWKTKTFSIDALTLMEINTVLEGKGYQLLVNEADNTLYVQDMPGRLFAIGGVRGNFRGINFPIGNWVTTHDYIDFERSAEAIAKSFGVDLDKEYLAAERQAEAVAPQEPEAELYKEATKATAEMKFAVDVEDTSPWVIIPSDRSSSLTSEPNRNGDVFMMSEPKYIGKVSNIKHEDIKLTTIKRREPNGTAFVVGTTVLSSLEDIATLPTVAKFDDITPVAPSHTQAVCRWADLDDE